MHARLSRRKEARILQLADDGVLQTQIAKTLGISDAVVSETLSTWADTRPIARRLCESRALELADRATKHAKVPEAIHLLEDMGVLAPPQQHRGASVQIVIGMPDQALGVSPTFEAKRLSPPTSVAPVASSPLTIEEGETVTD